MKSYVFISITALYFYTYLLLAFLSAKKSKLIRDFVNMLWAMILWTGGSLFMRLQAWPAYEFWYHVSLTGIGLVPCMFFYFIRDFCGFPARTRHKLWVVLIAAVLIYNACTGKILAPPEIVGEGEQAAFVYHMTWHVVLLYGLCLLAILHSALIIGKSRKKSGVRAKVGPLLCGILLLYAGHLVIPMFSGFPVDILSGVINAVIMFYTLYSRHVFRMTLLVSRGNCYIIAMGVSALTFYNAVQKLEYVIRTSVPIFARFSVMIVAMFTMVVTFIIYGITKGFFDQLFIKEELTQTERLADYTAVVSKSLRLHEICQEMVSVISDTLHTKQIYVCIKDSDGNYPAVYSSSPLDNRNFKLDATAPLTEWLRSHDHCMLFKDFRRTVEYKSMWEAEKEQLMFLKAECFLPLKDGKDLVGIVLMGRKETKRKIYQEYTEQDIMFLNSIESVSSIAVKNSRLYEKAYEEARTDEMTGLLNRKYFYEVLEECYEKCKNTSLALVIFNVDDFKLYNQLYGNQEGDHALIHIAQIIRGTVGDNGYCARYSSKEFAVILPEYDLYSAQNLAENISRQIQNINESNAKTYLKQLTVSCGISGTPYAASSMHELISNADRAVYSVKRSGKNGIRVYSDGMIGVRDTSIANEKKHKSMYSEYAPTIYALTAAIDAKDHYTFQHSKNVAYYAEELARAIHTDADYCEIIKEAGLLHDIGKIGIPENILNKKGRLTDEEYEMMKRHVEASIEIIRHLPSMDYVVPAVIGHHERYDGHGYPRRIAGKDIPLFARILCIADSFDAIVSERSYKAGMPLEYAVQELENGAGTQFDPELVPVFIELIRTGKITPVMPEKK